MKTLQSITYLIFLLAVLSFGGFAVAQDEHGGTAVEDTSADEHAGDEVDTDEDAEEEDADEEADSDEHAGDEA